MVKNKRGREKGMRVNNVETGWVISCLSSLNFSLSGFLASKAEGKTTSKDPLFLPPKKGLSLYSQVYE